MRWKISLEQALHDTSDPENSPGRWIVHQTQKNLQDDVAQKGRNLATVHRIFKRPLADVAQLGIILATIHQIASNLPADVD